MSSRLHLWITSTSQLHGFLRYSYRMMFPFKKRFHTASRHFVVVMAALRMLQNFIYTGCKVISQPSISDILKTCQYVETHYKTEFSRSQFLRSNVNFFAYFHSRGYPCLSRKSFTKVIHRVK